MTAPKPTLATPEKWWTEPDERGHIRTTSGPHAHSSVSVYIEAPSDEGTFEARDRYIKRIVAAVNRDSSAALALTLLDGDIADLMDRVSDHADYDYEGPESGWNGNREAQWVSDINNIRSEVARIARALGGSR